MTEQTPYSYRGAGAQLRELRSALANRYVIEHEIGQGGMAVVYQAKDLAHDRTVALKVLRAEMTAAVGAARFLREIEIERRLHHPNILPMFDWGWAGGSLYYTMPCVEGETLRQRIHREHQLPLADAIAITREVAQALDYAHAQQIVHRDIKPANILLCAAGALVADFGIARAMTAAGGEQLTASGVALGTPEYMSPEQGHAERNVDGRTDLYALGCVLYEMLAGEPPFTGPSVQAVIARHSQAPPPSLRIVRSSLPPGIDKVIARALAKVPADRFQTGTEFVAALDAVAAEGEARSAQPWSKRARMPGATAIIIAGIGILGAAVGAWMIFGAGDIALDAQRVVVFPLRDLRPGASDARSGEAIATAISYALAEAPPLRSLEGWNHLDSAAREDVRTQSEDQLMGVSRRLRAGHFIDGSIMQGRGDSVTVSLRLQRPGESDPVKTARASGPGGMTTLPALGLRAVTELLPALLGSTSPVDRSTLSDRDPAALANFLLGESEYRRMQFASALSHYRAALHGDSAFGYAALKGAQAANWLSRAGDDAELIDVAIRRVDQLPRMHAMLAKGIHAYVTGSADLAIQHLRAAIAIDSAAVEPWAMLGEVYARTAPTEPRPDSTAHAILQRVRRMAPDFAPALLLLEEMAVREGRLTEARELAAELRLAGADTTHAMLRELMLRCVREGPSSINWTESARRDVDAVAGAAKILSVHASQPRCAKAAFRAVLESNDAATGHRWAALLGLEGLLLATGDDSAASSLLESPAAKAIGSSAGLYILAVSAGAGFDTEAGRVAEGLGSSYANMARSRLWLVGIRESGADNIERMQAITDAARAKADSSRVSSPRAAPGDRLLAQSMSARLAVMKGDTAGAIRELAAMQPTEPRASLTWGPFESLGSERLLLARLLLASGNAREAERVASQLDATEPVIYLMYLRPSLLLRRQAAQLLRNDAKAALYRTRIEDLGESGPL